MITKNLKYLRILLSAFLLGGIATAGARGVPVKVTAAIDSTYILMGKTATISLDVVQPKGVDGHFVNLPADTLSAYIEVARLNKPDTTSLSDDREEIRQQIVIQSFDSGLYPIRPFVYAVGADTFTTSPLALKVLPAAVDTMTTIHDYAGVVKPRTKIWDYLPDFIVDYWWILAMLIAVALGGYVWWSRRGVKAVEAVPATPPLPPYELAMQQLQSLKQRKLCESGHEKEYYTILTEILRNYLDSRFGINAMEMTSTQIMDTIKANPATKPSAQVMKQILNMADFVKFAKVRPLPDENTTAYNNAVKFVEATRPQPEAAPEAPATETNETKATK